MKITHIGERFIHNGGAEIFLKELSCHFDNEITFRQSICTNPHLYEKNFADSFPHPVIVGGEKEIANAIQEEDIILYWGNVGFNLMNLPQPKICIYNACAEFRNQIIASKKYLTHAIACSTRTATEVCYDVPHTVILPGISTDRLRSTENRQAKRRALGIRDDDFLVGMISRLGPHKRPSWLVNAMKQNKNTKALFVGDGPLLKELQKSAPSNCIFVGHQNDIGNWWPLLDCYCLLSSNEGCPAALFEAMFCKIPIISTPVGSALDLLNDQNSILINEYHELNDAIEEIKKRNTLPMTQLAYQQFERHGKIKTTALRWKLLIKKLMQKRDISLL